MTISFKALCPICQSVKLFVCKDDFFSSRDELQAKDCPYGFCVTRERALAAVIRKEYKPGILIALKIHEAAPANRGMSIWLKKNCPRYIQSGYFPNKQFGDLIGNLRNENLESQTFLDGQFDLVIHLDVLEHLFQPFEALREIYRTLAPDGKCIFSVPTEHGLFDSIQVAFARADGTVEISGTPEYHGNPQDENARALVTWKYGYNLPLLISRETKFDVEVRRFQSRRASAAGFMTEIYILSK
jgi:SAM-dependent methyltransferase